MTTQTTQTANKNCILYYRVSRSKQNDQRQETDILEYCQKNNYNIVREAFREKISGTIRNRKAMTEAIEYAKTNDIKYLIVSELSRLGRSNEVNDIIEDLTKENICVITLKENIKTMKYDERNEWVKDDDQILLVGILTAINKKEADTIGYRIASGKRNSVYNKNAFTGGKNIAYGYESNEGILKVNDKEAEMIKIIFQKYCDGWGAVRIANWLNLNNYPTRLEDSKWSRGTINNILYNSIYIAKRKYKGDILHREELRIIDDITFDAVQRRRKEWKNANNEFSIKRKYDYVFDNRLIKCGICGKHYFGVVDTKRKRNFYKCTSGKYAKGCGNISVNKDWLDLNIQRHIVINLTTLIQQNIYIDETFEKLEIDYKILKAEQEKLIRSKDRYADLYAMDNISKSKYIQRIDKVNEDIAKLQQQLTEIYGKIEALKAPKIKKEIIKGYYEWDDDTEQYMMYKIELDKQTVHKIIKQITVNTNKQKQTTIDVLLNNGNSFQLEYIREPSKRNK